MQSLSTELSNSILTSGNHKKNITLTKHLIIYVINFACLSVSFIAFEKCAQLVAIAAT